MVAQRAEELVGVTPVPRRPCNAAVVPSPRLQRSVLLSPDGVARAAARFAADERERWMLCQARAVRRSYVAQVLDGPYPQPVGEEIWMLRQADAVRESYVSEVLERAAAGNG